MGMFVSETYRKLALRRFLVSRIPLKASPNVLSRKMGEDLVLLNLNTNRFFELNRTGARFWELLADSAELDIITQMPLPSRSHCTS
jgi:KinB signaling pathway activation protein